MEITISRALLCTGDVVVHNVFVCHIRPNAEPRDWEANFHMLALINEWEFANAG